MVILAVPRCGKVARRSWAGASVVALTGLHRCSMAVRLMHPLSPAAAAQSAADLVRRVGRSQRSFAGAVRILPWVLDPSVPMRVALPFARGVGRARDRSGDPRRVAARVGARRASIRGARRGARADAPRRVADRATLAQWRSGVPLAIVLARRVVDGRERRERAGAHGAGAHRARARRVRARRPRRRRTRSRSSTRRGSVGQVERADASTEAAQARFVPSRSPRRTRASRATCAASSSTTRASRWSPERSRPRESRRRFTACRRGRTPRTCRRSSARSWSCSRPRWPRSSAMCGVAHAARARHARVGRCRRRRPARGARRRCARSSGRMLPACRSTS